MKKMICGALAALVCLGTVRSAIAQGTADPRLDRDAARTAQALIDSARAERLPSNALSDVLHEGLSQHADGTRIVRAMRDYLRALRAASSALGAGSTESELVSGAGALLAGVQPLALTQLRGARGKKSVVVPLVVLGDLIARGVPALAAGSAIVDVAVTGLPDPEFYALRQRVEHDIAAGASASAAIESVVRRYHLPAGPSGDSIVPRRKPPTAVGASGSVELGEQAAGSFGDAALLASVGTSRLGFVAGPGARAVISAGRSWAGPEFRTEAWSKIAAWRLGFGVTVGNYLERVSSTASRGIEGSSGIVAIRSPAAARRAVASADTAIAPPPTPVAPTVGDSGLSSQFALYGTAAEARLSVARQIGRFELEGAAGIRLPTWRRAESWSSAMVTFAVNDQIGVVAGGVLGRADALLPADGLRVVAGVRIATGTWGSSHAPEEKRAPAAPSLTFRVTQDRESTTFDVRVVAAESVELTGDFTDWLPVGLSNAGGGRWTVKRVMEPGLHRVRVRVNGREWIAPPDLPHVVDLFGGEAGLLFRP